jgi:hypothetical protein
MRLYSYIIKHDTGFSPNPFHGYCTLACCKPVIRRTAKKGDWVVGLTPKEHGNGIVYLMRVDEEPISYTEYWQDKRFKAKKPRYNDGILSKCGDNIYEPEGSGYRQLQSAHSNGELENPKMKARDLRGHQVLISKTFAYFGANPKPLPDGLAARLSGGDIGLSSRKRSRMHSFASLEPLRSAFMPRHIAGHTMTGLGASSAAAARAGRSEDYSEPKRLRLNSGWGAQSHFPRRQNVVAAYPR